MRQVLARPLVAVRGCGHVGRYVVYQGVGVAACLGIEWVKLQDAEALSTESHGAAVACPSCTDRAAIDYIIEFIHYFNFKFRVRVRTAPLGRLDRFMTMTMTMQGHGPVSHSNLCARFLLR